MIRTQRGPLPEKSWRVSRRYNEFVQLNGALGSSGIPLPLPPKRIIGNMEPDFVAQRQLALQVCLPIDKGSMKIDASPRSHCVIGKTANQTTFVFLQNYLNVVLMNPILASSLPMKKFLDPDNYTAPLHGRILSQTIVRNKFLNLSSCFQRSRCSRCRWR